MRIFLQQHQTAKLSPLNDDNTMPSMPSNNDAKRPPVCREENPGSSKRAKHCYPVKPYPISAIQFPEDLLYEIFVMLPVKSLIRFRCVSKRMRGMIDSPSFATSRNSYCRESERSLRDDYAIILVQPSRLLSLNFSEHNLDRAKAIDLNFTLHKESRRLIGCCNGIFCFLMDGPESYVLWNPSNGTSHRVECSGADLPPETTDDDNSIVSIGYDYVNDDYKIVRFAHITHASKNMQVYSLRKKSWTTFNGELIPPGTFWTGAGVCVDGVMHWVWTDQDHTDSAMFIAAFDLVTETFRSLPLPLEATGLELQRYSFKDFGGRLCLTFCSSEDIPTGTVWVMEMNGTETSWTKLYNINCIRIFSFPIEERRLLCNSGWLTWWDPQENSFEKIQFPGSVFDQPRYSPIYIYVRNLIRLDQCPI